MNEIMQAGQFLSDTFSKLGDSFGGVFGGIAEGFSVAMDTVSSAMNGAKAGSMFGPLGASAGAAIGVVTSLAGAIAQKSMTRRTRNVSSGCRIKLIHWINLTVSWKSQSRRPIQRMLPK